MSDKKAEALRQINDIKSHLVDKQTFFPYNYNATYIWACIATILVFFMIPLYEYSILQGAIISFILISIGFIIEGFMTKKVNKSYDIEDCTIRQQFITKSFLMISLFLISMSAVLASYQLYIPMFVLWLFLVSLGYFSVGFVLNITRFAQMASFNMVISIILLIIGFINHTIEGKSSNYIIIVQFFVVLGLGIMPSIIAWQQIKEGK